MINIDRFSGPFSSSSSSSYFFNNSLEIIIIKMQKNIIFIIRVRDEDKEKMK